MAAPNIGENVISSNEFTQILDLTSNADVILNEAEAWAVGTKSGVPVTADAFSYSVQGGTSSCSIDEQIFREQVGVSAGYTRYFMFVCDGVPLGGTGIEWTLSYSDVVLNNVDLTSYGITITGIPLQTNSIRVVVTDSDLQYQNNAYYYAQQAKAEREAIEDLTVSAETIENNVPADVEKTIIGNVINLNFKIPKGNTGDVYFMTFDINNNGYLVMTKPDSMSPQVDFSLNDSDGNLYVDILD